MIYEVNNLFHCPASTQSQPVGMGARAPLGGLQPITWASIFQHHPGLIQPLLPRVHQELRLIFRDQCSWAAMVKGFITRALISVGCMKICSS